jgi:hypothetical protein
MGKVRTAIIAAAFVVVSPAWGQSKNLAPGFTHLPKGATIVIMPADIELFSMSAGGVLEPKADWTETATRHLKAAFIKRKEKLGLRTVELAEKDADELHEVNTLHAAVARAIDMHHFGSLSLPTKEGKLDWSLADAVAPVKKASGADYALFSWIRDSYASAERKAAMIGLALLGVGLSAGIQVGYASLVDLNTGQVVWFNRMARGHGDLREAEPAAETVDALLAAFPAAQ